MDTPKINFLDTFTHKKKKNKSLIPKLLFYPFIFVTIFLIFFSFQIIISGNSIKESIAKINIFGGLGVSQDKLLNGEYDDRINILLLGMGGAGHPGPYLTDTIMIASIKPSENKVALISVPRDLSVPIPGYGWRKINNANHFGEMAKPGSGSEFTANLVSKLFSLPIHYYIRVDFSGFEKLINELGGLKVYVDNSFTDYQFPAKNYAYQTVSFEQGLQKMDGITALQYARSRHGNNNENSDFARSKRQQKVLQAIKDDALSFATFLSYKKIAALLDLYQENVSTNLQPWEIFKFAKIAKKIDKDKIVNLVLDNGVDGPLYSTVVNDAYLLLPKDMTFTQLQDMVKYVFQPEIKVAVQEPVKIEIQNGTKLEGLAYKASVLLKSKGYKVTKIGNAQKQNYEKTIIYDLSDGQNPEALEDLKAKLNTQYSDNITAEIIHSPDVQFLVILGQDQETVSLLNSN